MSTMDEERDTTQKAQASESSMNEKETGSGVGEDLSDSQLATPPGEEAQQDGEKDVEKADPSKQDDNHVERSRAKIAIIMSALCMAVFLAALDITIITTALPTIAQHFGSSAGYTWIGSAYLLAVAAGTPIWGKLSDIFGRKPALLIANALFFVGSLIAALSVNIGMLITARALQGTGGGGLVVLVNITIGDLFSPRRRGAYYGIIGGVWAIASSLGPIIGGVFTSKVTWRWCFYINLPFDGLAFMIILFFLDVKTPRTPIVAGLKLIDWLGVFLICGGTLLLLFGLEYGGTTFPWDSATVLCLIIIGVALMVAFGFAERYVAKNPLTPPRIMRKKRNIAIFIVCFIHAYVFIAGSYYLPLYFQASLGKSPLISGCLLLANSVGLSIGSISTGIFIRKTGMYLPPIFIGFTLMTLGYGLLIDLDSHSNLAKIIMYQFVAGLGIGPNFQAPLIALQSNISPRDIGTATAAFGFIRNIGTSISVVVGGVIFQNEMAKRAGQLTQVVGPKIAQTLTGGGAETSIGLIDGLPAAQRSIVQQDFALSLRPAWIMYTAFAFVGLLVSFLIGRRTLSKEHEETKTGIEAEAAARAEREEEERVRKEKKANRRSRPETSASSQKTAVEGDWIADSSEPVPDLPIAVDGGIEGKEGKEL